MNLLASQPWIDFLLNIRNAQSELGDPEIIWFRGHGNEKYYLLPSLLRYKNGLDKEQYLFHKFRRFSEKVFPHKESEWETLFDMQHYGLPTRLLDWTETFGIALYFAAYNHNGLKGDHAAIYLLDPLKLNRESSLSRIFKIPYEEGDFSYSKIYWEGKPFKAPAPIAIEPIFRNDRILAQRGMFTVHHDNLEAIENKFPKAVKKVTLSYDAIPAAQEFLKLANINEFSVYPDLAGIANFLKKESGLRI